MIKGTAQKFETLSDGSCKLSIYFPREIKKQALELEGDESITMSVAEYQSLIEGKDLAMSPQALQALKTVGLAIMDMIQEAEKGTPVF